MAEHKSASSKPPSDTVTLKPVRNPEALGRLVRRERRAQGLTLAALYETTGLSTRFLSEFERGKPNASLGRVTDTLEALGLTMLVLPRAEAERIMADYARRRASGEGVD